MLKACLFATALLTLASVWSVNARAAQIDAHVVYIQAAKLDNLETVAEVHAVPGSIIDRGALVAEIEPAD